MADDWRVSPITRTYHTRRAEEIPGGNQYIQDVMKLWRGQLFAHSRCIKYSFIIMKIYDEFQRSCIVHGGSHAG
jgi:hypothetical protein